MIKFKIEHHKTFVEEASDEEMKALKKTLRIYQDFFNKTVEKKYQFISLYYSYDKSFPTGFFEEVKKKLDKKKITYSFIDNRVYTKPTQDFDIDPSYEEDLWENQTLALEAIKKNNVGLISSPTGTGKTRIEINTIAIRKVKTLVIVPTTSIQKQSYKILCDAFGKKNIGYDAPKLEAQYILWRLKKQEEERIKKEALVPELEDKLTAKAKPKVSFNMYDDDDTPAKPKKKEASLSSLYDEEEVPKKDEESYLTLKHLSKEERKKIKYKEKEKERLEKYRAKQKENQQKQYEKYKEAAKTIKLSKQQMKEVAGYPITIVCYQSLPNLSKDFLKSIECVIIDECHHSSANTIRMALDQMPTAAYRYGFSATPWRDKNDERKLLIAALGNKILYNISGEDAIAKGIIVKPDIEYIVSPTPDEYLLKTKHWRTIVEKGIVGNKTRNESIINRALDLKDEGHNVFICVDEVAHLEILQEKFKNKKTNVLIVHGQQHEKINDANVKLIGETHGPLISIGTMAVGEGTDMPAISCIILASGGKASIKFLQRIGRGTRKTAKKTGLLVIDFEDWFNPTLRRHTNERKEIFRKYYNR